MIFDEYKDERCGGAGFLGRLFSVVRVRRVGFAGDGRRFLDAGYYHTTFSGQMLLPGIADPHKWE